MRFRTGLFATLMATMVLAATYVPMVNAANDIKRLVPFQGRLHGTDSKVVTDGHYDLTFYIYDTPTGGTALWTEAHPKVSVIHGYINVLLGATTAMDEASYATGDPNYDSSKSLVDFTKQKFLGISINGGAEMFPRSQLVPSFHAYTANHAEHATEADHAKDSDSLAGIAGAAYVTEAELSGFSGGILHSSGSLGELADKAASRTNLDVFSKTESINTFFNESNNLSELTNSADARANLNVYSKTESVDTFLNETNNLSDLVDKAEARINLGVQSIGEDTEQFLDKAENLNDLGDEAAARTNLNVHSKTEAAAAYLDEANNLGDLTDASVARNNLGLDQNLVANVGGSYSRADIGNLRLYFGRDTISANSSKTITVTDCYSDSNAYSVFATYNRSSTLDSWSPFTSHVNACAWRIVNNNANTSSRTIEWFVIGHAN